MRTPAIAIADSGGGMNWTGRVKGLPGTTKTPQIGIQATYSTKYERATTQVTGNNF